MKSKLQYTLLAIASVTYGNAANSDVPQVREKEGSVVVRVSVRMANPTREELESCKVGGVFDFRKLDALDSKRLPPVIHFSPIGYVDGEYSRIFERLQREEFMRYWERHGFDAPVKIEPGKKNAEVELPEAAPPPK